jgi:hypothetical protein
VRTPVVVAAAVVLLLCGLWLIGLMWSVIL